MATSLVLVLGAAVITACGGGSGDAQTSSTEATNSVTTGVTSPSAPASAADPVTTNTSAVAVVDPGATSIVAATEPSVSGSTTSSSAESASDAASVSPETENDTVASITDAQAQSAATNTTINTVPGTTIARPAASTGTGFYVVGSKLYDAKGKEFRIRGVNRVHWDSSSSAGIALSGANSARFVIDFKQTQATNYATVDKAVTSGIVPMIGNWGGTCKSDPASLSAIVDTWVAQVATWKKYNANGLINIANEWGPANSTVWRDQYISAIARMRAAGYTGTLVVDAGGCGQDSRDIINYGAAVLAADPQRNILFDVHVYGNFYYPATASWMQDYTTAMAALKATGLPLMLGEFGPGKNIGPSPTMVTPQQIIATAEAAGWGWMAWAWDDNNLGGCQSNDQWFGMTRSCGVYKTTTDLTAFGQVIVPILKQKAVKATIFN